MVVTIVLKQESYSGNQRFPEKAHGRELEWGSRQRVFEVQPCWKIIGNLRSAVVNFPCRKGLPVQRVVQTILLHGRKIEVPEPEDFFLEKKIANSRQGKERPKGYSCLAASALFYHGGNTDY